MKRAHLIIYGDVIGVGFRAWVRTKARDLGLVGWVRNNPDDTLEITAEGAKDKLDELVRDCQDGPEVSMVEKVEVIWERGTGEFLSFEVET